MRKALFVALGVLALVSGVYLNVAHWGNPADPELSTTHPLYGLNFPTPDNEPYPLSALVGKVTVVNFWGTWCPPCVEEMPELNELYLKELQPKGVEMVGIAVDSPSNIRDFLQKTSVSYPILMAGFGGTELAKSLGNTQGGLPFTVILDEKGKVLLTKAGRIQMDTIRNTLKH